MKHPPRSRHRTGQPYIYPYAPAGRLIGYQVRFKRQAKLKVESVSRYFSATAYGSLRKTLLAAIRWRNRNVRWMIDPTFKPKFLNQRTRRSRGVLATRSNLHRVP